MLLQGLEEMTGDFFFEILNKFLRMDATHRTSGTYVTHPFHTDNILCRSNLSFATSCSFGMVLL